MKQSNLLHSASAKRFLSIQYVLGHSAVPDCVLLSTSVRTVSKRNKSGEAMAVLTDMYCSVLTVVLTLGVGGRYDGAASLQPTHQPRLGCRQALLLHRLVDAVPIRLPHRAKLVDTTNGPIIQD